MSKEGAPKSIKERAKEFIEEVGPSLGYDQTEVFSVPGREDMCVVKRTAENGKDYGFDTVYLVREKQDGTLEHRKIADSKTTKNYLHVGNIAVEGESVKVHVSTGGTMVGGAAGWKKDFLVPMEQD